MKTIALIVSIFLFYWLLPGMILAQNKVVVVPLIDTETIGLAVGKEIKSLPYIVGSPGFYYLARNLTYKGTDKAITVTADGVTIDLMGYRIVSAGQTGVRSCIYMNGRKQVEIRNGTINNFSFGIFDDDESAMGHKVHNIRALGNYVAIHLRGTNHLVTHCTASNNISDGIYVEEGVISECTAQGGGNRGIDVVNGLIKNCYSVSNRIGFQILSGSAIGNVAIDNEHYGFLLGSSPALPVLMDQNSASGNGINYAGGSPTWGTNAGR